MVRGQSMCLIYTRLYRRDVMPSIHGIYSIRRPMEDNSFMPLGNDKLLFHASQVSVMVTLSAG